jgi:hypothetical protein
MLMHMWHHHQVPLTCVDVFVASRGIPTLALVSGMWESLLAPTLHFSFCEKPFYIELGLGIRL